MKEAIEQTLAILRGMGVTLRHIVKEPRVTIQYPEERPPQAFRYRGIHQLRLDEHGKELCVGCNLCGLACPAECIYVEGAECSPEEAEHVSHYERYARVYVINAARCLYCGYCVEACPTDALAMTPQFELGEHQQEDCIYEKEDLIANYRRWMDQAGYGIEWCHPEKRDEWTGHAKPLTPPSHPAAVVAEHREKR
ncbi:MAG TPA: NADH-quinone oxidoreductase subunit I [Armatimonadota bacterium]|jgi:NADH-quinone oxidoreductase subunit I|nr:NADH-quinone oxidoreductase subunit I [Armatimonadota bacterium]HPT99603.1 NADH-quinone oxidoreductase subunit I [Armatimonadota bacterium]